MNPDQSASERARSALDSTVKSSAERTEKRVNDWTENHEGSTFSKVKLAVSSDASKAGEFASDTYQSVSSHFTGDSSEDKPNIPYDRQDQPSPPDDRREQRIPDDKQEQAHIQDLNSFLIKQMNPDTSTSERERPAVDSTASAVKSSAERTEDRVNDWAENQSEPSTYSKVKSAVSTAASKAGEFASDTYESVSSHFTKDSSEDQA
jgi:hypothetical protein